MLAPLAHLYYLSCLVIELAIDDSLSTRCLCSLNFLTILVCNLCYLGSRRATSHLEQTPEKLDNEGAASARSVADGAQKAAPLRKSQSGVATLGRLRVVATPQGSTVADTPATPEQERPRRRQPSVVRNSKAGYRDQSLTQFAVMDDENVSQQVSVKGLSSNKYCVLKVFHWKSLKHNCKN